jgi:hypothetical protein
MREKEEKEILYYDESGGAEINQQITNAYTSGVIEQRDDNDTEKGR